MKEVAFIGLGVMGFPVAGHLSRQGHRVRVYNRTPDKAKRWCDRYQGARVATPGEVARGAELVFIYADVQNMGGGRWDTSSLYARLQELKSLKS